MPTISCAGQQSIDTIHWVGWGNQDYIAARVLLLGGHVVQGAALAHTAIEKYLKAVCNLAGIGFGGVGHDVGKLNGWLHHKGILLRLRPDFLRFLVKVYQLRYPDELAPGFNIAVNSIATLTEMDVTVQAIRRGFAFWQGPGKDVVTKLEAMLESRKAELLTKNCAIGSAQGTDLFAQPSWAYDLRVLDNNVVMEASYTVERLLDDNNFRRKGLKPVDGSEGKSFVLAWPPKPETNS